MSVSQYKVDKTIYKTICIEPTGVTENKIGYIYVPWKLIVTKTIISDENGTRTIWQINKWERFKLFVYGIFHKTKKLKK